MNLPSIAICNFFDDTATLRETALEYGFSGVDWTLKLEDLPQNEIEESRLLGEISKLKGRKSSEIEQVLGHKDFDEIVHRDNLVLRS